MQTKVCRYCHTEKPLEQFSIHKGMADGRLNKCKACAIKYSKRHRVNNPELYKEYERSRLHNPERVLARKEYARSEVGKVVMAEAKKAYIERNPDKRKAHQAVSNAIRDGKLMKQPCEIEGCGESEGVEAHHDDYSKPLEVRWLCGKHHVSHHCEMRHSVPY